MSILWTGAELAAATKGIWLLPHKGEASALEISDISIDSRTLRPGALFIPLKGPRHDGHAFLEDAARSGAAAVMAEKGESVHLPGNVAVLQVDDSFQALRNLARAARARTRARIVAITGSVGKTTIRTAVAQLLGAYDSGGNLNNHIGLPLALARLPKKEHTACFELGMNARNDIAPLARLLRPHIAVITKIADTHGAHFPNIQAIADEKSRLFEGLEPGGTAILPADSKWRERMARRLYRRRHTLRTFGKDKKAHCRLTDYECSAHSSRVCLQFGEEKWEFVLGLAGAHHAENAACIFLTARCAGLRSARVIAGMGALSAVRGRGNQQRLRFEDGRSILLIDESYNASPASMRAALEALGLHKGRRVAILGEMLELAGDPATRHAELAESAHCAECWLLAGEALRALADSLPASCSVLWRPNSAQLASAVPAALQDGDVVMVKGSAGSAMQRIISQLQACAGERAASLDKSAFSDEAGQPSGQPC